MSYRLLFAILKSFVLSRERNKWDWGNKCWIVFSVLVQESPLYWKFFYYQVWDVKYEARSAILRKDKTGPKDYSLKQDFFIAE